jgi:hypothetical protein
MSQQVGRTHFHSDVWMLKQSKIYVFPFGNSIVRLSHPEELFGHLFLKLRALDFFLTGQIEMLMMVSIPARQVGKQEQEIFLALDLFVCE